jgi:hypothetical protein
MLLGAVLERVGHTVRLLDANTARRRPAGNETVRIDNQYYPDVVGVTLSVPLLSEAYRPLPGGRETAERLIAYGPARRHSTRDANTDDGSPARPSAWQHSSGDYREGRRTIAR